MGIYKAGKPFTLLQDGAIDSNTKLLIHSNHSNSSTDIVDSSASNHTITRNNSLTHSTSQAKFGASSLNFSANPYLTLPASSDWDVGSGDFTVDFWWYPNNLNRVWFVSGMQDHNFSIAYKHQSGNKIEIWASSNGSSWNILGDGASGNGQSAGGEIVAGVWQHIAVVRHGGTKWYTFHNGIKVGDFTTAATGIISSEMDDGIRIGIHANVAYHANGYIDEFRWSKGIARWTESFSPPSSPYPTFSTYNIDSVGTDVSSKDIIFPSNPSEDSDDIAFGVSSNVGAPILDVYAGGNVGVGVSGTPANRFEVQTGEVSGSKFSVSSGNDSNTVMLLQSDTIDGNTTIIDSSASSRVMTAEGIVSHSIDRSKFGKSSIFSGVNGDAPDKISYVQSDKISPTGTNDMTFDCWINLYGASNNGGKLWFGQQSDWYMPFFGVHTDRTLYWGNQTHGGANLYYHRGSIPLRGNVWEHIAVTVHNKTVTFFVNGIKDGTHTYTTGTWTPAGTAAQIIGEVAAWVEEVRISNIIRWDANFVPPEKPYGHELAVEGPKGNLYTVTDSMETHGSGSLFTVNTTGGLSALNVLDNGCVTKPYQPAFGAKAPGNQTDLAHSSVVTVQFDEFYDQGNNFSGNTFTAPVTGKYLLCFSLYLLTVDTDATSLGTTIKTSNRQYEVHNAPDAFMDHDDYISVTASHVCDMDAGDTAYIFVYYAGGATQMDIHGDSMFTGALIC